MLKSTSFNTHRLDIFCMEKFQECEYGAETVLTSFHRASFYLTRLENVTNTQLRSNVCCVNADITASKVKFNDAE